MKTVACHFYFIYLFITIIYLFQFVGLLQSAGKGVSMDEILDLHVSVDGCLKLA
jgi:hypothetical protein